VGTEVKYELCLNCGRWHWTGTCTKVQINFVTDHTGKIPEAGNHIFFKCALPEWDETPVCSNCGYEIDEDQVFKIGQVHTFCTDECYEEFYNET
jgi:hypothetical protein